MGAGRRLENGSECMLVGVRLPLFPPVGCAIKAGRIVWVIRYSARKAGSTPAIMPSGMVYPIRQPLSASVSSDGLSQRAGASGLSFYRKHAH